VSSTFDILTRKSCGTDFVSATDFVSGFSQLEVEENADMPGAFSLTLPVTRKSSGDLDVTSDERLSPLANIAVIARAADGQTHCLIDGFVLSHTAHLDSGIAACTLKVWGLDATWLMNTEEKTREWVDMTDGAVANTIFGEHSLAPADVNLKDDSPTHSENNHSLMQRATDAQFLRTLARRSGKLFRVFCTDTPGKGTGWFGKPKLDGNPVTVLTLDDTAAAANAVGPLEISWDVMRPTTVIAHQKLLTDSGADDAGGTTTDAALPLLEQRALADFSGSPVTTLLGPAVDDSGELIQRAQAVLREAGWFVRCTGSADTGRLGSILRVGTVVRLDAAGALHSGKYFVWSVRHRITAERHVMEFVLLRNAIGQAPTGGLLSGGSGQ
jgi:hypothetical protein